MKFWTCAGLMGVLCLLLIIPAFAQDAAFWFKQAEQESQSGKWSRAMVDYREAIRHNPKFADAYIGLARTYNSQNDYEGAIKNAQIAVRLAPNNMLAYYNLGAAYYQLKKWDKAEDAFSKAYGANANAAESNIGLGLMHLHFNRIPEAIKSFEAALKITPDSSVGHLGLGMAYVVAHNRLGAESQYDVLQVLDPKMARQLQRAMLTMRRSDDGSDAASGDSAAKSDAQAKSTGRWSVGLISLFGGVPVVVFAGWFLYMRNRPMAEPLVSERIEIKDPNTLSDNAIMPVVATPFPRAVRRSQEILPPTPSAESGMAGAAPRPRPDSSFLDTPSHLTTSNSQFRAGNTHFKAGRYQEALDAYKDALRMNPNYWEAFNGLGQCYAQLEEWVDAADAYKQALRVNPDNAAIHSNLGDAYLALERTQDALEAYKQAIRLTPNDPKAHYQYGLTSIALNDKATALDEYKILKKMSSEMANKLFNAIYPS